ncbi:MAG TPA: competence protein CoiA family protein [Rhabdochlamydiaceae bacterium]|nr:competence protein CoiA family protein [Rhabdochlamydiaceae bacterium]
MVKIKNYIIICRFMQLYAISQKNLILASRAEKGKDYLCPECKAPLRVRGGQERQLHFFHLSANPHCKQHQKGVIHLKLQLYLQSLLKEEDAQMEYSFPQIGRIADIACLNSKRIFEIQYSPISLEEAAARTKDYQSLGFQLIWLLHDHQFNKRKVTAAELFLRKGACYFTDFDENGIGIIYDQFEVVRRGRRLFRGKPTPVDLSKSLPSHSYWEKLKTGYDTLFHLLLKSVSGPSLRE